MLKEREINAKYDGMIEGITLYAHWKDGVQYVGTTGKTLKKALEDVEKEREEEFEIEVRKRYVKDR